MGIGAVGGVTGLPIKPLADEQLDDESFLGIVTRGCWQFNVVY